ncbi:Fic family protein [Xenophilus arseniciresistens]|uniref:Fic family protein n=1 Tax=Xenophilus arseniciresistens TaxID=1283306 RepID=A0AAE3NAD9_9BURK|nr:Fic family protein [Xenophilus arseniciresistens]MDA7417743.1 Fic family protein [Xenophilus arseniciresistens]
MKFEGFSPGVWRQQYQYKSFAPVLVNQPWVWEDPRINTLLEQATRALGELNAFSLIVPDVDLFIEMHIAKEANQSSRIEGTQTAMDEAVMSEELIAPEKRDDWHEVRNYIDSINTAVAELQNLPLSNRLLRDTHAILMRGVRGEHKMPGEFRTSQNWIGGSGLKDAAFVPPHPSEVPELMSDLEKFWHNEAVEVPDLVRIAISHYQFETIHPFCDGNGRIGRLLITLYLVSKGLLYKPALYLSDFFERNRASYYDALMAVRTSGDMNHWVRFFLTGVAETATNGRNTFQKVLGLRTESEARMHELGRRGKKGLELLRLLYRRPVVTVADVVAALSISAPSANALVAEFVRFGLLREQTGYARNRVFAFESYLKLFLV